MAPVIRPAVVVDVPRLIELIGLGSTRAGKEDGTELGPYLAAFAEIEANPHNVLLVAVLDGTVVGVCQLFAVRHLQEHGGLCAEIESMHVHPEQRGGGIGGQLLGAAVAQAREWGCYRVQLCSNRVREDAHRFYARNGFTPSHLGFKLWL